MSGSMQSNVGNSQIYNDNEQRTSKSSEADPRERFEFAPKNAHNDLDSKDERSLGNRLASAQEHGLDNTSNKTKDTVTDPLKPAQMNGNEPSKGAKIDAELQREEQELLENKGKI
ncbi:MAG: hypothetical protein NXY57DRAFT_942627 [Lentinula lateritia]|uniref:Uncharacterized protein n=1 Tax=Lentinula lateritia TaxID=40482 RepID=A0ABQ8VHZ0_9AGAR|nr:MAG: hypothetical protein NXY57DRAFT_942627 [Lentinula lateritia]KAJ4495246.1 hypothetical protein C8R41DRAFT_298847 [Lentinula lateritia]